MNVSQSIMHAIFKLSFLTDQTQDMGRFLDYCDGIVSFKDCVVLDFLPRETRAGASAIDIRQRNRDAIIPRRISVLTARLSQLASNPPLQVIVEMLKSLVQVFPVYSTSSSKLLPAS